MSKQTYKANKNIHLLTLNVHLAQGDTIELEQDYAAYVNDELKLTFPDVEAVLELVEEVKPTAKGKKKGDE